MYNRETKNLWLVHDDASTEQLGTASTEMVAYDLLASAGFMRMSDWLLVADGAPFRAVEVRPINSGRA